MAKTILMVGTRKGCFLLESDESRRDWDLRGPLCENWPIYHAVHDADSGAIYAAAASEWHGASVWRSPDLGETWEQSSEGLTYADTGLKLSKVSGLTAAHGRLFAGVEMPGVFESRDGGETWSLLSTLEDVPDREKWNDPANQPPGHLGVPAVLPHPDDPSRYWAIVQGVGIFETTDDGKTFTPRVKVSDRSFSSRIGFGLERGLPDLGSRLGLVSTNTRAFAVWTDTRAGSLKTAKQDLARAVVAYNEPAELSSGAKTALTIGGIALIVLAILLVIGRLALVRSRR